MLVTKNDYLVCTKDNAVYRVVLADEEDFAIARAHYDAMHSCWSTNCEDVRIYSNMENINSLEDLGFKKANKKAA